MKAIGISDIGRCRKNNEDAIFVPSKEDELQNLFIVADGMGGCNAGEVASSLAIEAFLTYIKAERLHYSEDDTADLLVGAMVAANKAVFEKSNTDIEFAQMGTTLVAMTIYDNKAYVVYVGDSRAYLFRKKHLRALTTDHSYVMELVKMGSITMEQASLHPKRNVITRAVGIRDCVEADCVVERLEKGDLLLLCSDGLTNMIKEDEIAEILGKRISLEKKTQRLVEFANQNGGHDNISLILVDIGGKG